MNKKTLRTRSTTPQSLSIGTKYKRAFLLKVTFQNAFALTVFSDFLLHETYLLILKTVQQPPPHSSPANASGRQRSTMHCHSPTGVTRRTTSMLGPALPNRIYRNSRNNYCTPWKPNWITQFSLQTMLIKGNISPENEEFLCNASESASFFCFLRKHIVLDKTGKSCN